MEFQHLRDRDGSAHSRLRGETVKYLVLHGHFYQPPRENAWTGEIEDQPGAAPYANWNERIWAECYHPNAAAQVLDVSSGKILQLVNNYRWMNFNFGPTLMTWMEKHHPETYRRILAADAASVRDQEGAGNAIAQAYHHAILPFCNDKDLRTEIRWGIKDFSRRFQRAAKALWLPETACNRKVLAALIEEGMTFVILAPQQAGRIRPLSGGEWTAVDETSLEIARPYRWMHPDGSGRFLSIFFYHGAVARQAAFENILASSQFFMDRLEAGLPSQEGLMHMAVDGETFGHHFKFGDRTLAYTLTVEAGKRGWRVVNYETALRLIPATHEVELNEGPLGEGSSWSCAHGVGRWIRDCGCHTGGKEHWNQSWRTPLRQALDLLRDHSARFFEDAGSRLFRNPWEARDDYLDLFHGSAAEQARYWERFCGRELPLEKEKQARMLLEMQRFALRMYTSCGWFFHDLSGIETRQILQYAGKVMDFFSEFGEKPPEGAFLDLLSQARSNLADQGTGADIYRKQLHSSRVDGRRMGAHLGMLFALGSTDEKGEEGVYDYALEQTRRETLGQLTLATGRVSVQECWTKKEESYFFAALHLGGPDLYALVKPSLPQAAETFFSELWEKLPLLSLPRLFHELHERLGEEAYGIEQLLPHVRKKVFHDIFRGLLNKFYESYAKLYEENKRSLEMLQAAGFTVPRELRAAAEFTLEKRLEEELHRQAGRKDLDSYKHVVAILEEAQQRGCQLDRSAAASAFSRLIEEGVQEVLKNNRHAMQLVRDILDVVDRLALPVNLEMPRLLFWEALEKEECPSLGKELREVLGFSPDAQPLPKIVQP